MRGNGHRPGAGARQLDRVHFVAGRGDMVDETGLFDAVDHATQRRVAGRRGHDPLAQLELVRVPLGPVGAQRHDLKPGNQVWGRAGLELR